MKKLFVIACLGLFLLLSALTDKKTAFFNVPPGWPQPAYNFSANPLSKEKIDLGRALFYDPILSRDSTISCTSCHSMYSAFTHVDHALSHGIKGRIGKRNSPALMNLAWQRHFMWDGAISQLEMQPLAPISNPLEMDFSIAEAVKRLNDAPRYRAAFYRAFGDSIATGQRTLKALAQFVLTLVSANSKYDSVMRKQAVFNPQELNGYRLFRENCASCHKEPLFTTGEFANNGLAPDTSLKDYGRMDITKNPADSLKFKIPSLRNIEFSYPYMHDGRFSTLRQVLDHYTEGIHDSKTLAPELRKPIVLSSNEKVDLIAFLLTLSDKKFLFDPAFSYPRDFFSMTAKE